MANARQQILAAEDWKKIYQSYQQANFDSFDFTTLRRSMINYLRTYYPEDFNDYVESSEYLALIDLIAFVGQSISFRSDLAARENFLDTAERRDSVLRLARMLGYNPKRNLPASGLLKITGIATSQDVYDDFGNNLANVMVNWNDAGNPDYYEHFQSILNAAINKPQKIGRPLRSKSLGNINNELYTINLPSGTKPIFSFSKTVNNTTQPFELVGCDFADSEKIYERPPVPGNLGFLYRTDGRGLSSVNTGFFMMFKQGKLNNNDFSVTNSIPNNTVDINVPSINETDLWMYEMSNGSPTTEWVKLESVVGTNAIYNSLSKDVRNFFAANTRDNDQVTLVFSDGVFGNIPRGNYRLYYRTSAGLDLVISPLEFRDIEAAFSYVDEKGYNQTLTLRLSLTQTVSNSAASESTDDIKRKVPQKYYTQDRMISGEDYNTLPLTTNQNVVSVKAINRTASGISKYFEVLDPTSRYSSTVDFSDDGIMYREESDKTFTFSFLNDNDILKVIRNTLSTAIAAPELLHFYFANYTAISFENLETKWHLTAKAANGSSGYFVDSSDTPVQLGDYSNSFRQYLRPDALIKFKAEPLESDKTTFTGNGLSNSFNMPEGVVMTVSSQITVADVEQVYGVDYYMNAARDVLTFIVAPADGVLIKIVTEKKYFNEQRDLISSTTAQSGYVDSIWTTISSVEADGAAGGEGNLPSGQAPVFINELIPSNATLDSVYPALVSTLPTDIESGIIERTKLYRDFGLRYDYRTKLWHFIEDVDLDTDAEFSLSQAGNEQSQNLDASWLIQFTTDGEIYTVTVRGIKYVFESAGKHRFYFENSNKIYDYESSRVIRDRISVLQTNPVPNGTDPLLNDQILLVYGNVVESDGFVDTAKVYFTFYDQDDDTIPDNIEIFENLVAPDEGDADKKVFFEKILDVAGEERWISLARTNLVIVESYGEINTNDYSDGQIFFVNGTNAFYILSSGSLSASTSYRYRIGREGLKFQHTHFAPSDRRIDPSVSNIIDVYMMTRNYDRDFRNWLTAGQNGTIPEPPTSEELLSNFDAILEKKSISDEVIFHSVRYRPLFGYSALNELQATFKVVKSPNSNVADSEIKTRMISTIDEYFSLGNFEFGESFYFTDLSAHLHKSLAGLIASVVIVPLVAGSEFGTLFEIKCPSNEIFISTATVDNVEIIDSLSPDKLVTR